MSLKWRRLRRSIRKVGITCRRCAPLSTFFLNASATPHGACFDHLDRKNSLCEETRIGAGGDLCSLWHTDMTRRPPGQACLAQFDLVLDLVRQADAAKRENHLRRQLLMALETAARDRVAHRLFDFALRGDADFFQELAQAGVEQIFVHENLQLTAEPDC